MPNRLATMKKTGGPMQEEDEMLKFAEKMASTMGQLIETLNQTNVNVQQVMTWLAALTFVSSAGLHAMTKQPENPGAYMKELLKRSAHMLEASGKSPTTVHTIRQILDMAEVMDKASIEESLKQIWH
jgi:hypothetical protein